MDDLEMIAEKFPTNGIESASIVVCEGSFTLEGIDTEIRFRIHRDITAVMPGEPYGFELSHWIHTPQQAGPYTPSAPWCPSVEWAVRRAVKNTISDHYDEAVNAGREPEDSWLIPNSNRSQ